LGELTFNADDLFLAFRHGVEGPLEPALPATKRGPLAFELLATGIMDSWSYWDKLILERLK